MPLLLVCVIMHSSQIKIIDPCIDPRWDKFVENHPLGWIVHTSGWKKVLESSFPHMKGHYFVLVDSQTNAITAGLPIYEIRSWLTGNRLISIPYATLCDPLISSEQQFTMLIDAVLNYANKNKLNPVNVRLFQTACLLNNWNENIATFYKTHQLMLQNDLEETKKTFNRNIKRIIKAFENNALTVRIVNTDQDILNFYHLYSKTRKRLGLPTQPYHLLQNLFKIYSPQKQISLLIADYQGMPIGGLIVYKYKDRVSSEFLASEIQFRHMNTDHFLYWNAIQMACIEGYKMYDFGRTAINNNSLSDFKRRWGTTESELPEYQNPKSSLREETRSYKLAKSLCKNAPEPIFQALSNFCYRHLG